MEVNWISISSLIAVVAFTVYQVFTKKVKERQNDYDKVGDGLIQRLELMVNTLTAENEKFRKEFALLQEKFAVLQKEHEVIKEILQGRDKDTVKFRDEGMKAFEVVKHVNDLTVKTHAKTLEIISLLKPIK